MESEKIDQIVQQPTNDTNVKPDENLIMVDYKKRKPVVAENKS